MSFKQIISFVVVEVSGSDARKEFGEAKERIIMSPVDVDISGPGKIVNCLIPSWGLTKLRFERSLGVALIGSGKVSKLVEEGKLTVTRIKNKTSIYDQGGSLEESGTVTAPDKPAGFFSNPYIIFNNGLHRSMKISGPGNLMIKLGFIY